MCDISKWINLIRNNFGYFLVTNLFLIVVDHAEIALVARYAPQIMIQEHVQLTYVLLGERGQIILLALVVVGEVSSEE